jgi:hypothetical protein
MQGIKKNNPKAYTTCLQASHLIYNHREKLVLKEKMKLFSCGYTKVKSPS